MGTVYVFKKGLIFTVFIRLVAYISKHTRFQFPDLSP